MLCYFKWTLRHRQLKVIFCDHAWSKREQRKSFVSSRAYTLPCSVVCLLPWVLYYKWRLAQGRKGWMKDCRESDPTYKKSNLDSRTRLIAMFPFAFIPAISFVGFIGNLGVSLLFCWQTCLSIYLLYFLVVPWQSLSEAGQLLSGPWGAAFAWTRRRLAETSSFGLFCGLESLQLSLVGQTNCNPYCPFIIPSTQNHWFLLCGPHMVAACLHGFSPGVSGPVHTAMFSKRCRVDMASVLS